MDFFVICTFGILHIKQVDFYKNNPLAGI